MPPRPRAPRAPAPPRPRPEFWTNVMNDVMDGPPRSVGFTFCLQSKGGARGMRREGKSRSPGRNVARGTHPDAVHSALPSPPPEAGRTRHPLGLFLESRGTSGQGGGGAEPPPAREGRTTPAHAEGSVVPPPTCSAGCGRGMAPAALPPAERPAVNFPQNLPSDAIRQQRGTAVA